MMLTEFVETGVTAVQRADTGIKDTNPKDAIATDKRKFGLFPDTARLAGSLAFLEGALKYGRYNWRVVGVRASVYKDALDGHLADWWAGEDLDPDSGLPHLYKALACIAILIDAKEVGKLTDDRPPSVAGFGTVLKMWAEEHARVLRERHADKNPRQYTIADTQPVE